MPTLNWIGKDAVVNHHHHVPFHLLKDVPSLGCGDPGSGNLIVQGDNLVALKALLPYYAGQVKCIYIDPPYNTGNEGWVYNDNVKSPIITEWLGKVVGGEGETLDRQHSTDWFYPDFLCELEDGRVMAVEYKGADRYDGADAKEKRAVGKVWESRSAGKCLFEMPTRSNFSSIAKRLPSNAFQG